MGEKTSSNLHSIYTIQSRPLTLLIDSYSVCPSPEVKSLGVNLDTIIQTSSMTSLNPPTSFYEISTDSVHPSPRAPPPSVSTVWPPPRLTLSSSVSFTSPSMSFNWFKALQIVTKAPSSHHITPILQLLLLLQVIRLSVHEDDRVSS